MAIWKQAKGWTYEVFSADAAPEEAGLFASLVELWQSKRQDGHLPAWKDFDFADFNGWYGKLRVGDFMPGCSDDYVYGLWGEGSVEFYGVELTGKRMSEVDFGFDDDDRQLLRFVADEHRITLGQGPVYWQDRDHVEVAVIKLPLADDGKNVDKFLGAFQPMEEGLAAHCQLSA